MKSPVRLVIDTDVVVAALRSPSGASAALVRLLIEGTATWLLSAPLAFEYEATCLRAEHLRAAGLVESEAVTVIATILDVVEPVEIYYRWRPQLHDAGDEMVLEAAVNGQADAIVTFNRTDYGTAPARFGIAVMTPGEVLPRIRT
jgi:putative PIN family toxin of toxin-antitoxin system